MPIRPLEALADAIMYAEGWRPCSVSNRNRNPGNLRRGDYQIGTDPEGYAVFTDLIAGYGALLRDLAGKVSGKNEHGLGPESTIQQLCDVYAPRGDHNNPDVYCYNICWWLDRALGRPIASSTKLSELMGE